MKAGYGVICIDDSPGKGELVKGRICPQLQAGLAYRIEKVWEGEKFKHCLCTVTGIDLGEVDGKPIGFSCSRFRKIEC